MGAPDMAHPSCDRLRSTRMKRSLATNGSLPCSKIRQIASPEGRKGHAPPLSSRTRVVLPRQPQTVPMYSWRVMAGRTNDPCSGARSGCPRDAARVAGDHQSRLLPRRACHSPRCRAGGKRLQITLQSPTDRASLVAGKSHMGPWQDLSERLVLKRPLCSLLRKRPGGIFACGDCCHACGPHPEGPPVAGVSKDGRRESLFRSHATSFQMPRENVNFPGDAQPLIGRVRRRLSFSPGSAGSARHWLAWAEISPPGC